MSEIAAAVRMSAACETAPASNTAGVSRFPEAAFSLVRVGIGLLGYANPVVGSKLEQSPVLRLVTQVVSVKHVPCDSPVGYGLTFSTGERERRIAVVAIGYGDGFPWGLSNKAWMVVHGTKCPVVGRVCMDVTLLDVSDVPQDVMPGDEVVVFGAEAPAPTISQLADLAQTIPYELLTRLSGRIRRIYRSSS